MDFFWFPDAHFPLKINNLDTTMITIIETERLIMDEKIPTGIPSTTVTVTGIINPTIVHHPTTGETRALSRGDFLITSFSSHVGTIIAMTTVAMDAKNNITTGILLIRDTTATTTPIEATVTLDTIFPITSSRFVDQLNVYSISLRQTLNLQATTISIQRITKQCEIDSSVVNV